MWKNVSNIQHNGEIILQSSNYNRITENAHTMNITQNQNQQQSHDINRLNNINRLRMVKVKHLGATLTNRSNIHGEILGRIRPQNNC
jgi:hypothetical protein